MSEFSWFQKIIDSKSRLIFTTEIENKTLSISELLSSPDVVEAFRRSYDFPKGRRATALLAVSNGEQLLRQLVFCFQLNLIPILGVFAKSELQKTIELLPVDFVLEDHGTVSQVRSGEGEVHPETVLISCTSGTTCLPKGVEYSAIGLAAVAGAMKESADITESARILILPLLQHMNGFGILLSALFESATVIIPLNNDITPEKLLAPGVNAIAIQPSHFIHLGSILASATPEIRREMQWIACGSGTLTTVQWTSLRAVTGTRTSFLSFYALTEAPRAICLRDPDRASDADIQLGSSTKYADVKLLPVEGSTHFLEIAIGGPILCLGYVGVSGGKRKPMAAQYLRTGDLGTSDSNHRIFFAGRKAALCNVNRRRFNPFQIERIIRLQTGRAACIFPIPVHGNSQDKLCLSYEETNRNDLDVRAIVVNIAKSLEQEIGVEVVLCPQHFFKRDHAGKVDRRFLESTIHGQLELADALFPDVSETREDYLNRYPSRNLKPGAHVTRYAPSPTGFQHIGGVFAALVNERLARQTDGVFYLRIEDTDQKREIPGAIADTVHTLNMYGIEAGEGMLDEYRNQGEYGPYKQSSRKGVYTTFAKELVQKGMAYPCFCREDELSEVRVTQTSQQLTPGYWGAFARCREISPADAINKIKTGQKWVLRLKSQGNSEKRIECIDLIKGTLSLPENDHDIVLIKGDGLPTYHFAHAIDDALMHTTHVIRGEEWLSSLPIHIQLFHILGFMPPLYAHIPNILKKDGDAKRKLSKRKDPESAVSYYDEQGYPPTAVVEYLLNIINSAFEVWREKSPDTASECFAINLEQMSKSGALFDLVKLDHVSKNVIARMGKDTVFERYISWAHKYEPAMHALITNHEATAKAIFDIGRGNPKPRKDFSKWREVKGAISYFFDELFVSVSSSAVGIPENMNLEEAKRIVKGYSESYCHELTKGEWFEDLKQVAIALGYAPDRSSWKSAPGSFKGTVSDVATAVRFALTRRIDAPDLHSVMQILGEQRVRRRFAQFLTLSE